MRGNAYGGGGPDGLASLSYGAARINHACDRSKGHNVEWGVVDKQEADIFAVPRDKRRLDGVVATRDIERGEELTLDYSVEANTDGSLEGRNQWLELKYNFRCPVEMDADWQK